MAGAEKLCCAKKLVFIGRSASIGSSRFTTPVRGLTCFRNRETVARDGTERYPPLVMTSLPLGPFSIGCGARRGFCNFLLPQVGHCGRRAT